MNFLVCDTSLIGKSHLITDEYISYENGDYWNHTHPPISFHAYAAAMEGRFISAPHEKLQECIQWADCVIIGVNYDPKLSQKIIEKIKSLGKVTMGFFHENGSIFQYNAKNLQWLLEFKKCANSCDYFLTCPQDKYFRLLYTGLGISNLIEITQPYDLSKADSFKTPLKDRKGIFIGPKRKDIELEQRNWLYNIIMAANVLNSKNIYLDYYSRITSINISKDSNDAVKKSLEQIFPGIEFNIQSSMDYKSYLKLIGTHQAFVNFDSSFVQGQVSADSLYVGVPLENTYVPIATTDFDDKYLQSNLSPEDFMQQYCSFKKCKETITNYYNLAKNASISTN